jgi:hypothetical protein
MRYRVRPMSPEAIESFYRAAHLGLRVLDERGARRRFGADADARWKQFRGDLNDADRLNLLQRDASTVAPLAFAPREVFSLTGLSVEDAFGPVWPGSRAGLAGDLLRAERSDASDPLQWFEAAVAQWPGSPPALDGSSLPKILPSTRLVFAGLGALRALVTHFAAQRGSLDLADQLLLVSDRPAERQLFGLAAVFLGTPNAPRALVPSASKERVRALGVTRLDAHVVSEDATPAARDAALALADVLRP